MFCISIFYLDQVKCWSISAVCFGTRRDRAAGMQKGARAMEEGRSVGKGWMMGGIGIEEVRQGRRKRDSGKRKGKREDARQGGGRKRGSAPRTKLKVEVATRVT